MLLLSAVVAGVPEMLSAGDHGFQFIRIKYQTAYDNQSRGWGRGWGRGYTPPWQHDYPTAELNLYEALERTTKIKVNRQYLILTLKDKRIFEYPILYLSEPGFWHMDETEVKNLREYLERGGFVLFDDFRDRRGSSKREWNNFYYQIKRTFPKRDLVRLDPDHPVWSVYYEVDPVEAPTLVSGLPRDDKYADEYYTMYDDKGRMMMLVCYNQDIGDGWEWPNRNLNQASTISFQMGINFIIYALTH